MPNLRFSRKGSRESKSMGAPEEYSGYENGPDFSFYLLEMQGSHTLEWTGPTVCCHPNE